jgi:Tol biopolymer transport system component
MNEEAKATWAVAGACITIVGLMLSGCSAVSPDPTASMTVPRVEQWGIYSLDLATEDIGLIYSSVGEISGLRLSNSGDRFVFSQKIGADDNEHTEICTVGVGGSEFERLTDNELWDLYPAWSPDDSQIAFLSWRDVDLDIYVMAADGTRVRKVHDSGSHDADIDWRGDKIAFTTRSQIWSIGEDGSDPTQITHPPRAGEWGNANLPFGDYDPRWSPDGTMLVFERLEDDTSPHGNYNLFLIGADGSGETRLTDTGYSQGLASWSRAGHRIAYVVAAMGTEGMYDIYVMNADGTNNHRVTPDYFPAGFLCHSPIFSADDTKIYFVGQWWE